MDLLFFWIHLYPEMVSEYPTYMWWRQNRKRNPTDCFSTVTETVGKKLVRTRSYGFMYPYIYI